MIIFMHFFDKLFSYLFGGLLPKKPRPFQSSLCVTAALLGWLMVREQVLKKFNLCKSLEFVSTLYLLEDVIPLVYFQYQIFRTGNLALYMSVMAQMAILFNIWRRSFNTKCWKIELWPTFRVTIAVTITWNLEYTSQFPF